MVERDLELRLDWTPRKQNVEADALTNSDFLAFDPSRRFSVDLKAFRFKVLDKLMGEAEVMYDQLDLAKELDGKVGVPAPAPARKRPRGGRLKEVDPW